MKIWDQLKQNKYYIVLILAVFITSYSYIFQKNIDLNGDNASYYLFAKEISKGNGYSTSLKGEIVATNNFPPVYSHVMAPLMWLSDDVKVFKIQNGILFILATILFYFILVKVTNNKPLALLVSLFSVINVNLLRNSTIMMSETLYMVWVVIAFILLFLLKKEKTFYKQWEIYALALVLVLSYLTRTFGLALIAGVGFYLLFSGRWKFLIALIPSMAVFYLPWYIRTKMHGFTSRYVTQFFMVNPKRPEMGNVSLDDLLVRFSDNLEILFTRSIPNSLFPFYEVQYGWGLDSTAGNYIVGGFLLALMIFGIYKINKEFRLAFLGYMLGACGMLMIVNGGGGGNRYFVPLIPLVYFFVFYGVANLLNLLNERFFKMKLQTSQYLILGLLVIAFSFKDSLKDYKARYGSIPPVYENYFSIAKSIREQQPDAVIIARKPALFHLYSESPAMKYKFSDQPQEVIEHMILNKIDYVVVAPLGFSSTQLYLAPAINSHIELFTKVQEFPHVQSYFFKFEREKAIAMYGEPEVLN